ncbi:hypothetical protein J6590_062072, partial [Homalodisca vitripennis]
KIVVIQNHNNSPLFIQLPINFTSPHHIQTILQTSSGPLLTPEYISPEQFASARATPPPINLRKISQQPSFVSNQTIRQSFGVSTLADCRKSVPRSGRLRSAAHSRHLQSRRPTVNQAPRAYPSWTTHHSSRSNNPNIAQTVGGEYISCLTTIKPKITIPSNTTLTKKRAHYITQSAIK